MFKVKATQHVLAVNDLEKAENYFLDKLGFAARFRVDGWSFLSLGSFHVMLGHCPDEVPARDTHNHSYFAYVNCEGIDEIYRDYQQRGVEICQAISDQPWGIREFGLSTPEGHRIMFGEDIKPAGSAG
jgi:uncharacterized glyoxalase superfamily protein PhnB